MVYLPKSQPAPACLEQEKMNVNGNYDCGEVLERLQHDFKNKCYICESGEPTDINTEHFIPHKGDKQLKFDWNNLFFSCSHCNSIKGASGKYLNILNCTNLSDKVDTNIYYSIIESSYINEINIIPNTLTSRVSNADKVLRTASLLNAVYNGTTPKKRMGARNLRNRIIKEIRNFNDLVLEFENSPNTLNINLEIKDKIIFHLSAASPFAAFKRWIVWNNKVLNNELGQYCK